MVRDEEEDKEDKGKISFLGASMSMAVELEDQRLLPLPVVLPLARRK